MFAEVIPFLRLPRALGIFDYQVPQSLESKLEVGQIVRIPFRGRQTDGLVLNLKKESTFTHKKFSEIIDTRSEEALLSGNYLTFLVDLARDLFVSPALLLRTILPSIPSTQGKGEVKKETLSPRGRGQGEGANEFHCISTRSELKKVLTEKAREALANKTTLFLLFPLRAQALAWSNYLKKEGISHLFLLPTHGKTAQHTIWQTLLDEPAILVSTAHAAFYPMPAGGTYVIIDETADEWKQEDQNPRFEMRTIIPRLAHHFNANVFRIGSFPTLKITNNIKNNRERNFHDRENSFPSSPFSISLIDLHKHERAGNKNMFTDELFEALKYAKQPLLLSSQKETTIRINNECVQSGIQNATVKTLASLSEVLALPTPPLFDLVAIVEADFLLHRPDFRSQEKLAAHLADCATLARDTNALFLIQTAFPDQPVWQVALGKPEIFWNAELEERRQLHYPPYYRLVKIIIQNRDELEVKKDAATIFTILKDALKSHPTGELVGPFEARPFKLRANFRLNLMLRFPRELFNDLKPHLATLPDNIVIDLDPASLL